MKSLQSSRTLLNLHTLKDMTHDSDPGKAQILGVLSQGFFHFKIDNLMTVSQHTNEVHKH